MRLSRQMELQRSWIKLMVDAAGPLCVFSLQYKTNLPGFVLVILKPKPTRHKCFGDANSIELAAAELGAEAMHSQGDAHTFY